MAAWKIYWRPHELPDARPGLCARARVLHCQTRMMQLSWTALTSAVWRSRGDVGDVLIVCVCVYVCVCFPPRPTLVPQDWVTLPSFFKGKGYFTVGQCTHRHFSCARSCRSPAPAAATSGAELAVAGCLHGTDTAPRHDANLPPGQGKVFHEYVNKPAPHKPPGGWGRTDVKSWSAAGLPYFDPGYRKNTLACAICARCGFWLLGADTGC